MRTATRTACLIALLFTSTFALADGLITNPPPVPNHWRVGHASFTPWMSTNIFIQYLRSDNTIDHEEELHIVIQEERDALFRAQQAISGSDEATLLRPDGTQDLDAIYILRISRWLIATGKLSGVTAVPTPAPTP